MPCSKCNKIDFDSLKRMPEGTAFYPYDAKMNRELPGGGLFELNHPTKHPGHFHITYKEISNNAASGACVLCKLMCKACQQFRNNLSSDDNYRAQYKPKLNDFKIYLALSDKYSSAFTYWTNSESDEYAFLIGEIGLVTQSGDPLHSDISGRPIASDPRTKITWWDRLIKDCDNDPAHDKTPLGDAISRNNPLPPRVLDVSQGQAKLFLWEPPTGTKDKYITLSYRWPELRIEAEQYAALGASLQHLMNDRRIPGKGLKWKTLHKTYQDIVNIAIDLGIDYVWIDGLCIIQDDPADKSAQLGKMGDIYKNSYLTVCGSDGVRPFTDRDGVDRPSVPEYHPFSMKIGTTTGQAQAFEVPYGDVIAGAQVQNFGDDIVSSRGWTFQERVLSPRTLFFTKRQVYFECSEYCVGEDGFLRPGRQLQVDTIPKGVSFREYWWSLVAMYCTRELGRESDKLTAIGGLAQVLDDNHAPGRDYMAGLWTGPHFLADLLWSSTGDQDAKRNWEGRTYRAPSWSWAAVDGQVSPPVDDYRHCDELANLVGKPVVTLKHKVNKYGEVTAGHVTIDGPRIKARVYQKLDPVRLSDGTKGVGDQYRLVTAAGTVLSRGAFIDYNVFMDELRNWSLSLLIIGKVKVDGERIYPALVLTQNDDGDMLRVGTVEITRDDLGRQSLDDHPEVKYRQYKIV